MIESAAYDIIKQEGRQEGKLEEALKAVLDILEARFDVVPESIVKEIRRIEELGVLKALRRNSARIATLDELRSVIERLNGWFSRRNTFLIS